MHPRERIFVALDTPTLPAALALAEELAPWVGGFKIGLELCTGNGGPQVVEQVARFGRPIFFDGKFHDIPNTVAGAARAVGRLGVAFCTVHAFGGAAMLTAAAAAAREGAAEAGHPAPIVLAVTILTSLRVQDFVPLFPAGTPGMDLPSTVVTMARLAMASGCGGVVASPQETAAIRAACGPTLRLMIPGVRPVWSASGDQARAATPADAIRAGADFVVIGRPITQPPATIGRPADAARRIIAELEEVA